MEPLKEYYARRAAEFETVYLKPELQADLEQLKARISGAFHGMNVLEVACGTGYWTQFIARTANSILATDIGAEVLDFARQKSYGRCRVNFAVADAFTLSGVEFDGDSAFCGFWWSHILLQSLPDFLGTLHSKLPSGSKVVLLDNRYAERSSSPIDRVDELGNTYQVRRLQDGSVHEIPKNFHTEASLRRYLAGPGKNLCITMLEHYWLAEYRVM